ncbi:MAG: hypothetical protein KTR35_08180 [Gammaproteobacteria bacterium]|nr:hypothetical protein [Gammaproteobacteria bacterium]
MVHNVISLLNYQVQVLEVALQGSVTGAQSLISDHSENKLAIEKRSQTVGKQWGGQHPSLRSEHRLVATSVFQLTGTPNVCADP